MGESIIVSKERVTYLSVFLRQTLFKLREDDDFLKEYLNQAIQENDPEMIVLACEMVVEARSK